MCITATELKENLGKYLNKSLEEEIYITKNGKVISKLTNPFINRVEIAKSLFGVAKSDIDPEEIKDETASRIMADYIITQNADDFRNAKSFIITPEQLNREFE